MKHFLLQIIREYCVKNNIDPWKTFELDKILGLLSNEDQYNNDRYQESIMQLVQNENVYKSRVRFVTQFSSDGTSSQKLPRIGDSLVTAKATKGHVTFKLTSYNMLLDKVGSHLCISGTCLPNFDLPEVAMNYTEITFQLSDPEAKLQVEWELCTGYDIEQSSKSYCSNESLYDRYRDTFRCWLVD